MGRKEINYIFNSRIHISNLLSDFSVGKDVSLCGRLVKKRRSSKITFLDIADSSGIIQTLLSKEYPAQSEVKEFLPGNFYAVYGKTMETESGERSILIEKIFQISHANKTYPNKIEDSDLKLKQRYLQILADDELRNSLRIRCSIITLMREYLNERDFLEVDTPILQANAVVGTATPFITHSKYLKKDLFLRGSCEIKLKQLVVAGYEKIYEIGQVFRNESESLIEFPLLEIQEMYKDYIDASYFMESMLKFVYDKLLKNGYNIALDKDYFGSTPWTRVTIEDVINKYHDRTINLASDREVSVELARLNLEQNEDTRLNRAKLIDVIIKDSILNRLSGPVFILDYPKIVSPLAKAKEETEVAERGYLFIDGVRLAEVVTEENNPKKQQEAFDLQDEILNHKNHSHQDLIKSLEYGFPISSGIGLNINRLIALLTGYNNLEMTTFFPLSISKLNK